MHNLKTTDFICIDPTNEQIAQNYMDLFVAYKGKKPHKKDEPIVLKLIGGKDNFKEANKRIKDQEKEIKKYFPNMQPAIVHSELPDEDY